MFSVVTESEKDWGLLSVSTINNITLNNSNILKEKNCFIKNTPNNTP